MGIENLTIAVNFEVLDRTTNKWTFHDGFEMNVLPRENERVIWDGVTYLVHDVIHDMDEAKTTVRIK